MTGLLVQKASAPAPGDCSTCPPLASGDLGPPSSTRPLNIQAKAWGTMHSRPLLLFQSWRAADRQAGALLASGRSCFSSVR